MCRCVPPSKNEASNSNFNAIWDLPLILWFEQKNKPALLLCFIACLTKLHYNIAFFRVCIQRCPVLYGKEGLSLDVTVSNMCLSVQSVQSKLKVTFANKHTWKTFFFLPRFLNGLCEPSPFNKHIFLCAHPRSMPDHWQLPDGTGRLDSPD